MKAFRVDCEKEACSCIGPSSSELWIHEDDCNIQSDIKVDTTRTTLLWGYVTDPMDMPVEDATVTLHQLGSGCRGEKICHTHTDCNGYYQFELPCDIKGNFRVVATKNRCMRGQPEGPGCPGCSGCQNKRKPNNICYYQK